MKVKHKSSKMQRLKVVMKNFWGLKVKQKFRETKTKSYYI